MQHEHALRAHAQVVARNTAVALLTIPQVWGMKELRAHYPAYGEAQILALLEKHCGYVGTRGKPVSVHVDQVLKLDSALRAA